MVEQAMPSIPPAGKKRLSRRSRQIFAQVVVGLIILICGIIIGTGATVLHFKGRVVMPPGPRPPTREVVEDMATRYNLTPEQVKKVEAVFEKRRETLQSTFEEFRRKSEAEFKTLSTDIKNILTPEQYARWEQDFQRRRRPGPWERGPGRPGEGGPGRRGGPGGPGDRGPGRGFGDRGPGGDFGDRGPGRDFRDRGPGRDFRDRDRALRDPNISGPNTPEPNVPEPNTPTDP
jgi:hypothetical protein